MALQKALKSLPFVEGLETKTDPKLSAKPALLYDAVFRRGSVSKRWGRALLPSAIASGGNESSGEALFPFNQELVRINGGTTYGLSSASQTWSAKSGGNNYCSLTKQSLIHNNSNQVYTDHAVSNGVGVLAWVENFATNQQGLHIAVYDVATGAFYQQGFTAISGSGGATLVAPRCIPLAGAVVVVVGAPGPGKLFSTAVSTSSPTSAPASLATIKTDYLGSSPSFDAFAYGPSYGVVVYPVAASKIAFFAIDPTGAILSSPAGASLTPGLTGAINGLFATRDTQGNIYAVYGDAGAHGTRYIVVSPTFASVLTQTSIVTNTNWSGNDATMALATGAEVTANNITLVMNSIEVNPSLVPTIGVPWIGTAIINSSGVATAFSELAGTQGMGLTSGLVPFDGTYVFGAATFPTPSVGSGSTPMLGTECSAYVLTIAGQPIAKLLSGQSGMAIDSTGVGYRLCASYVPRPGQAALFFPEQGPFQSGGTSSGTAANTTLLGVAKVVLSKISAGQLPIVKVGQTEYIGGALPRTYDGVSVVETGFEIAPNPFSLTAGGGGTGALSTGTYQYALVCSWINAQGEITRSIASTPLSITLGSPNLSVIIKLETLPASTRDLLPAGGTVIFEVYRTIANGTVFYSQTASALVASSPVAPTQNVTAFSGTSSGVLSITDKIADTSLQAGQELYTTGGVLDWETPPPYASACAHNDRLVVISSENPYSWWPSSEWSPDETVRFSSLTANYVPSDKGPLVGCASMDGKLVLFAQNGAYLVYGDGPDQLGNNNYPPPQPIASVDAGPVTSQSVITTPLGVMYQGPQGIALLDRGLNYQFIGTEVEAWTTGAWKVRSALLDATTQEVRFQADTGSDVSGAQQGTLVPSNGGVTLVYNYLYNQWSVFAYGGQAMCLYQGNVALVQSTGPCWIETPGTFRDAGAYYSSSIETAWLKLAGLQGFQRLWYASVLGTYASDFTFGWHVAYNYNSSSPDVPLWSETVTLNGVGLYALDGTFQARHHIGHKCEAVKFLFTDSNLQGSGEGMALTELTLEYGIRKGAFKLPAANTL